MFEGHKLSLTRHIQKVFRPIFKNNILLLNFFLINTKTVFILNICTGKIVAALRIKYSVFVLLYTVSL
jgi:hypothetical protein